jgi:4-amino-4-deoxy-L-arabinose transferase-like glycosyltransferase
VRPRLDRALTAARRPGDAVAIGLALLVLAGIGLRGWLMVLWRPAFLGFPDSAIYFNDAFITPFWDPLRVVGYGFFVSLTHAAGANLSATILLQHALGIASALLLYAAVRRTGGPSWLGLAPAAVVLLGGQQILIEHAVLSESLFVFGLSVALWCAAHTLGSRHASLWAAGAGLALGAMLCVRLAGAATVPALALWLLLHGRGRARRLIPAAALLAGVLLVAGSYLVARHDATGDWAMTRSGGWNLYARAATFADCTRFTPPPGTRRLCESTPPSQRPGPSFYAFAASPAHRAFGGSAQYPPRNPKATDKLEAFARAAILHQPVAYAKSIARNLWRFAAPDAFAAQSGNSPSTLVEQLVDPTFYTITAPVVLKEYGTAGSLHSAGIGHVLAYERHTRIQGLVIAVLALLALLGVVLARGPARAGPDLYVLVVLALVLEPVATVFYDARYAIPVNGPLAAAAAYGLWIGASRLTRARPARRAPEPGPAAQPQPV